MNLLIVLLYLIVPIVVVAGLILAALAIRAVPDHQRLVVFRGGQYAGTRGPGRAYVLPLLETASAVDMREKAHLVDVFDTPTRDGAPVSASLDYSFKVTDPRLAAARPIDDSLLPAIVRDELAAVIRALPLAEVLPNQQLGDSVRQRLAARLRAGGLELTQLNVRNLRPAEASLMNTDDQDR